MGSKNFKDVKMGDEQIMKKKSNGTCSRMPQESLLFGVDPKKVNKICCHNRHFAEASGYHKSTSWADDVPHDKPTKYYDSIHCRHLFTAPKGRTWEEFHKESTRHGWPSFRDAEVNWEYVRVLPNGETVTTDGVHLGHNIPDQTGNRYCINLVCVAGNPDKKDNNTEVKEMKNESDEETKKEKNEKEKEEMEKEQEKKEEKEQEKKEEKEKEKEKKEEEKKEKGSSDSE